MLRSPAVFDSDATIQSYVKSGKAHLLKGDALVENDVKHAWDEASTRGPVDLLLFSVGMFSPLEKSMTLALIRSLRRCTLIQFPKRLCHHSAQPRHASPPERIVHYTQTIASTQNRRRYACRSDPSWSR